MAAWLAGALPRSSRRRRRRSSSERWLAAFGPATETDIRWWTGWTAREARAALAAVPHAEVDLDGATGYVLAGDLEPTPAPAPSAAFLPTLDPTTMGWKERDWYLGRHAAVLFDSNGNAGPTVWWDGRVVGGWSQRRDGEIVFRLLEDVGADARAAPSRPRRRASPTGSATPLLAGFLPPFQRALAAGASVAARQEDLLRDHEALDLRRALVDLEELRVAHQLLDRVLLHVAVAAEDLHGVGRDLHRRVGREPLRERRLQRRRAVPWSCIHAACQTSSRAASISVAMSAIMKLTPWCIAIGTSNVTRCFA